MKILALMLFLILSISSCSLFTPATVSTVLSSVEQALAFVEKQTNKRVEDVSHNCETEYYADTKKYMILCEFDLSK
jgi:PBP1b-binding outer membrane lipoprotein LpoB